MQALVQKIQFCFTIYVVVGESQLLTHNGSRFFLLFLHFVLVIWTRLFAV
jgi:hypothetical protein